MEQVQRIQLGGTYRDRLTGFEGVAIGRYDYLTGCQRVTLQARHLTDGKTVEITVDAPLVEFVEMSPEMADLRQEQRARIAMNPIGAPG